MEKNILLEKDEAFIRRINLMIVFIFIFQVIDVYGTMSALNNGFFEANPVTRNIINNVENPYLFLMTYKTSFAFLLLFAMTFWRQSKAVKNDFARKVVFSTMTLLFFIYFCVTLIHIYILVKAG